MIIGVFGHRSSEVVVRRRRRLDFALIFCFSPFYTVLIPWDELVEFVKMIDYMMFFSDAS